MMALAAALYLAQAGSVPPTDIELKAAYCAVVARAQLASVNSIGKTGDANMDAALSKMQREGQENLDRLRAYILPRMTYLDPVGLLAATRRGQVDAAEAERIARAVGGGGRCETLTRECMAELGNEPVAQRMRQCASLDWLPF
jgi:hypothetical protein